MFIHHSSCLHLHCSCHEKNVLSSFLPIYLLTLYLIRCSILIWHTTGDKTSAKELAIKANVPIITGSDSTFSTPSDAKEWIEDPSNPITYPVIVKAAMG